MDHDITVETTSTFETTAPPDPVRRPRSRLGVAMLVVAGLLLVGSVVFGVRGMQSRSTAADERDLTTTAVERRHRLARVELRFDADRAELEDQLFALPDKYYVIGDAFTGLAESHDSYVDVLNHSVDLYNAGDTSGSVTVLQADGARVLDGLMTKKTESQQAVQAAEDALHQLQEAL